MVINEREQVLVEYARLNLRMEVNMEIRENMAIGVRHVGYVYKFLGKTWLQTLQSGMIHVSCPREFNDPFDCSLACTGQFTEKFKRDWAAAINIDRNHSGFDCEMAEWENDYRHDLADRAMFDFMARILCVSSAEISKSDELLMWGHYACNYTGAKFVLDWDSLLTSDVEMANQVTYDSIRPSFNLEDLKWVGGGVRPWPPPDLICKALFAKNPAWAYEKEFRLLVKREACGVVGRTEKYPVFGWKFPEKALHAVYLGPLVSYKERSTGLKFILERMPWVRVYQTSLDEATYSLRSEELDESWI